MEVSEYLKQDLKGVTKGKPADRVVMSKLTRQFNRNDFLTRKRQISDSPLPKTPAKPQRDTKKEESKRRLEQLKKWQQERDKRKREEQSKKKPIFKVCHVNHAPSETVKLVASTHKFRPPKNVQPISLRNTVKKGDATDGVQREPASRKQLNFGSEGAGVVTRSQAKKQHLNEAESQPVKKAANMETGKSAKSKLGKNVPTQNKNGMKTTEPKIDNQKKSTSSIKSKAVPKPAAKPPPKQLKATRNTNVVTRSKPAEGKVHSNTNADSGELLDEVFTTKVVPQPAAKPPLKTLKTPRETRSKAAEEKVHANTEEESNSPEGMEEVSTPSVKELVRRFSGVPEPSDDVTNGKSPRSASKVQKTEINSERHLSDDVANGKTRRSALKGPKIEINSESVSTGTGSSSSSLSTEYPISDSVSTPKSDCMTPEDANRSGTVYVSPFVTMSRGKTNARKEFRDRRSKGGTYSEAPDVTGVKAGAEYFHNVLDGEVLRIENMCEEWNKYKNDTDPPEEACNMINVATGQSQLLITKRMKQFRGLICSCEAQNSNPPITCEDLHGYWDLLQIQVRNLDSRFENLVRLRNSNWEEVIPEKKAVAKEPVRRKKKVVKAKSSSSIRDAIKAARMKKTQGGGGDEKVFDGRFFAIVSPNKSATTRTSSKTPLNGRKSLLKAVLTAETRKSSPGLVMMKAAQEARLLENDEMTVTRGTPGKSILKATKAKSTGKKSRVVFIENEDKETDLETDENNKNTPNLVQSETKKGVGRRSLRLSRIKLFEE